MWRSSQRREDSLIVPAFFLTRTCIPRAPTPLAASTPCGFGSSEGAETAGRGAGFTTSFGSTTFFNGFNGLGA